MTTTIWISGKTARILVRNHLGNVIDTNDDWNNIASAQMAARDGYPEAKETVVRDEGKIKDLDCEWSRCRNGS